MLTDGLLVYGAVIGITSALTLVILEAAAWFAGTQGTPPAWLPVLLAFVGAGCVVALMVRAHAGRKIHDA